MKHIILIIASMLFSTLFYSQHLGLNLFIFSIITLLLLFFHNPEKIKTKRIIIFSTTYLISAILVFINHSSLAIFCNCVAFFTLVGSFSEAKSSIYIYWINGMYSSIAGIFHRNFETQQTKSETAVKKEIDIWHRVKLIGIPIAAIFIFVLLYKNGNPIFNDYISKINFDFINIKWILFCILGFYLFSNIIIPVQVEPATSSDLQIKNQLHEEEPLNPEKLKKEQQLGTTLMALLNLLILFYIATDIAYLFSNEPSSASHFSAQVHNGINALIASIIFAIIIIIYFFRGNLNFYEHNKVLKNLSYSWIALNMLLVILIAIKNYGYVTSFGLTYKRIGVFVYLLLTLGGLITTFLKVYKIQNIWFLFRINTRVAFAFLIVFSFVNWDNTITTYNLYDAKSMDMNYLIELSDNNAITLKKYADANELTTNFSTRIDQKHKAFMQKLLERNWQEYTLDNYKTVTNY